ncbi:site-specific integrase [Dysgonomonas sp. ZJ709]|uniref:site-specific integrase n=1 Tax=Dysgonomonas sp. ZJ709 TaxID=2709797 RepID=UPI0013EA05C1|nr:site-specific integrase [Dysgonomonas sp. ZJ709]
MKDYSMRYIFDRKNETGYRNKIKGKKYKDLGLIQIEIRKDGTDKRAYVSTNVKVTPDQFAMSDGVLKIKNHDNAKSLSGKIRDRFNEVAAFISSDKCNNLSDVKYWDKDEVQSLSLIRFIEQEAGKENLGKSSLGNFNSFMARLNGFGKIKTFADLTYSNIADFDTYLRKYITSQPTLYKKHAMLKHYIIIAIKRDMLIKNPYDNFEVKKGKHKEPTFLTPEELQLIINYIPVNEKLERVKDLFLFQCFTGMAYVDMQAFSKSDVVIINEEEAIKSSRIKTDESYVLYFLPIPKEIAEKYNYNLPTISNQKYNDYLDLLAAGAGINKNVTSHCGRHSILS